MNNLFTWQNTLYLIIFIIGLIFFCTNSRKGIIETFNNSNQSNNSNKSNNFDISNNLFTKKTPPGNKIPLDKCPNILMKKDNLIYLFNTNLAKVPGVNPIIFNNLEEYTEFVNWQSSQNINCPVLFLNKTYDTQNNTIYKVQPNPFMQPEVTLQQNDLIRPGNKFITPLVNAALDNPPYNQNEYASFDPQNQYIGDITPLDKMFYSKDLKSPNPMDPNWGGHAFTQSKLDKGKFTKDEILV